MSDNVIIGVDHGYAAMKSAHFSFPTGLVEYEYEPYTRKDVLELDGRYYVVGTGRQPLQKDKTTTEDYYLLTLAAIAKELEHRQAGPAATVHLAAGLPLTSSPQASYPSPCQLGRVRSFRCGSSPHKAKGRLCGGPMRAQRSGSHGERRRKGAGEVFAVRRKRSRADFAPTTWRTSAAGRWT